MKKIERAVLSVSDKTGLVEFAKGLAEQKVELLSTGGTAHALREAGLAVVEISDFTGFPEILDGRIKTLHPKIHAGLLFKRDDPTHTTTMQEHQLHSIDLLCVNLYPFEETIAREEVSFEEAVENIDVGGTCMLRSAAKNMKDVTVAADPKDYMRILENMQQNGGKTSIALRMELAQKVFVHVAQYNAAIAQYLTRQTGDTTTFVMAYGNGKELRYGENPHQKAMLYTDSVATEATIAHAEQLSGKEMSYNNYVDGNAALEAVKEMPDSIAVAIIKHTNPCGFSTGNTLVEAMQAAWQGDPVSAFGSVIAVSAPFDLPAAKFLQGRFVEVIIAPDFEPDALEFLNQKSRHLRLLKLSNPLKTPTTGQEFKHINEGLLLQDRDKGVFEYWKVETEKDFPENMKKLAEFGMRVCKHVKSNAILLVHEYKPKQYSVLGMGAGQPNRVDAVRKLAITKAKENIELNHPGENPEKMLAETVLISDAFFPFPDNVEFAAEAGIQYMVEPGGSKKDDEVIATANRMNVSLVMTGMRHFKH